MNARWKGAALALALAAVAQGAAAQLFDDNEARRRIADTNVRLSEVQRRLEERIGALEMQLRSGGLVELANQIDVIKGDIAKLRGQIEVLTFELGEAQKRQRDLYVDLDSRMRRLENAQAAAAAAPPPASAPVVAGPPADPGTGTTPPAAASAPPPAGASPPAGTPPRPSDLAAEQRAYDTALDLFKRGDYAGAITGFGNFVRTYPRTPLASSAQYWIGNAHFARRDYRASITAQRTLIANYPESGKVPDALLNIASAQTELGDNAGARRTLEELVAKHPQSEAAAKARQRLAGR